MDKPEVVTDFYGVYLLICLNPKYKGRTYIGYTRDPTRRIKQHNRGMWAGGAHKTNNKGPWKMVLIVHGFPNNISALRFEWAWQNPSRTTRLQHLNLKKIPRKESELKFKIRIISEMLRVGPWYRLPLNIRWLENKYFEPFPIEKDPPNHMPILHGAVRSNNKISRVIQHELETCSICLKTVNCNESMLCCLSNKCNLKCHILCLADVFLEPGEFVPIQGNCPLCKMNLKWGDMIKELNGSHSNIENSVSSDDSESHIDDDLLNEDL